MGRGRAFDHSAPVSALRPASDVQPSAATVLRLSVNGETRQRTTLGEMVHSVPEIIAALSRLFELKAGDLIFTGTPAGVAALQRGDSFHAELEGIAELRGRIALTLPPAPGIMRQRSSGPGLPGVESPYHLAYPGRSRP